MSWWFPEGDTPSWKKTVAQARKAYREGHGAFGRFAGRPKDVYTLDETIIKHWLDRHGLKENVDYFHNYHFKDAYWPPQMEMDFFLTRSGYAVESSPAFHFKEEHPVTAHVRANDIYKIAFLAHHGIPVVVITGRNMEQFTRQIEQKLGPLVRH